MPLIDDLRREAAKQARLIDRLTAAFQRELDPVLSGVTRGVRAVVEDLPTLRDRLVARQPSLARVLGTRPAFQQVLDTSGYTALVDAAFEAPMDDLTFEVLRARARFSRRPRVTMQIFDALKDIMRADLFELGDKTMAAVWRATVDGVLSVRSVPDLVSELAELVDVSRRQARTLHDTAVSTYARQVDQVGLLVTPADRFLYLGPLDGATRPFCAALVNEIRTRAEIDELSNGQIPNTLLTAGGYNCRHKWQAIGTLSLTDLGMAA